VLKLFGEQSLERPYSGWKYNVKMDLAETGCEGVNCT